MNFNLKSGFKIQESWAPDKNKQTKQKPNQRKSSLGNKQPFPHQLPNDTSQPSTDIIDDSLLKLLNKQRKQPYNQIPKQKPQPNLLTQDKIRKNPISTKKIQPPKNQDTDLLSSMANRLQKLQKTCHNQRQQIKEQKQILDKIKTQNTFLKQNKDNSYQVYQQMQQLKQKNIQLQKKVTQMQNYLKQYGLKWIGKKIQGNLDDKSIKKQISQSKYAYRLPSQIDISTIRRRVNQLNIGLQSQGFGTQICNDQGIHKFKKTQNLPIGFYSNGIVIKGFNFYPYKSKQSLKILSDILDGYFPYIFKSKYPNGVLLQVIDHIDQTYIQQKKDQKISNITDNNKNFEPMSKQQFLNKLPQKIIKNNKIIQIRGQISKIFNGNFDNNQKISLNNQHLQQINGVIYIKNKCREKIGNNQYKQQDVCTLKIRDETGSIYILHMQKQDKIIDILIQLRKIMRYKFNLQTNYPKIIYTGDQSQTLQQLNFYPNQNLHIKQIK